MDFLRAKSAVPCIYAYYTSLPSRGPSKQYYSRTIRGWLLTCTAGSILVTTMYASNFVRKTYLKVLWLLKFWVSPFRVSCFTMTAFIWFAIRCRGLKPLPNNLHVLRSHCCHAWTSAPRPVAAMSGAYVAHHLAATHFLVLVPRPQRHQSLTPTLASMVPSLHVQSCNRMFAFSAQPCCNHFDWMTLSPHPLYGRRRLKMSCSETSRTGKACPLQGKQSLYPLYGRRRLKMSCSETLRTG